MPTCDPNDFDWYPLQHHFGLAAFGVNLFGGDAGTTLVAEHDELKSGQEELYVVVRGAARFTLDGQQHDAPAIGVVAIPSPEVTRAAVAIEDRTLLLAIGAPASSGFTTTWRTEDFERVSRAD